MNRSFTTCLTPEEHFHRYGTLAPEQVAEFMELVGSGVDVTTADEIADLLGQIRPLVADDFEKVLSTLDEAPPTTDLVGRLRAILQHSFHEGEPAMELLAEIERDQASSAFAVRRAKINVEELTGSAVKFADDLEKTLKTVNDKLGV